MYPWPTYVFSFLLFFIGVCGFIDSNFIGRVSEKTAEGGESGVCVIAAFIGFSAANRLREQETRIRRLEQQLLRFEEHRPTTNTPPATQP